ncbi:MAG TPA: sortase [Candidatus Paceibacterota bacterium]|nr:sortase [Candidatus Paceibacterota bacterium]
MTQTHGKKQSAAAKTGAFLLTFVMLFAITYGFLAVVDVLPEDGQKDAAPSHIAAQDAGAIEAPVRVKALDVGLDANVTNPNTTDLDALDAALENGAVRYPTSAMLGQEGTVLLFGHSSYLPVVYHQYYKTFNKVQNLTKGQVISVYSGTMEYRYAVTNVRVADATEDVVELASNGKHLVLVTCDSFKSKSSRFVVTADFVGTYSLAN